LALWAARQRSILSAVTPPPVPPAAANPPPTAGLRNVARLWLLIPCLILAALCALVPFTGLRALAAPTWAAVVAALLVFPGLPLLWHVLAEWRGRIGSLWPLDRLGLRSLAVGALVLAVSLSSLGPKGVGRALGGLVRFRTATRPALPPAPAGPPESARLEALVPADARLVVALSDAQVVQRLLAAGGLDASAKVAALQKCQIAIEGTRMIIAARDPATRMVVVHAPGVTDPRNLYCLVGVLGSDSLKLRFLSDKAPVRFEVSGLGSRPLTFSAVDGDTVLAAEGGWASEAERKAAGGTDAPLASVVDRVDRHAGLWAASVTDTSKGRWDLALDARLDGGLYRLRGSSVPPSGSDDHAEIDMRLPLAFASALPDTALKDGLRGLVRMLAAAASGPPPTSR
jgi:hypothetical protein